MMCPICGTDCKGLSFCDYCGQDLQEITELTLLASHEDIAGNKAEDNLSLYEIIKKRRKQRLRCPQCGSMNSSIREIRRYIPSIHTFAKSDIALKCRDCGYCWKC